MASTRAVAASPTAWAASAPIDVRRESVAVFTRSAPEEGDAAVGAQRDRRSRFRREDLAVEYDRALQTQPAFVRSAAFVASGRHPRPRPATDDGEQRTPQASRRKADARVAHAAVPRAPE